MRRLSAGKPFKVNSFTLVAIEETTLYSGSVSESNVVYASKKPKALVVLSEGNPKAFDMDFNEIPIEELIKETDGLNKLVNIN